MSPAKQSLQSEDLEGVYLTPLASQSITAEVDIQGQQHRHSVHSPRQYPHPEWPYSIPTDNPHIPTIREMNDPSYSVLTTHPQFRYDSAGFQQSMTTYGYQAHDTSAVPPLANTVYYPYPNYYSPFVPQYPPQTTPATQVTPLQGTYFYTPGYPHLYPQNPTFITTITSNAPRQQPQLNAPPPRWPPAQHSMANCAYMTYTFTHQAGTQPMQPSFSHPAPSIQQPPQQYSAVPPRYIRRHSHPSRNPPARVRISGPELPHPGWAQVTRGNGQSGSQSTTSATATPIPNIPDSSIAHTASSLSLTQPNPPPYPRLGDEVPSMQTAETLTPVISGTHPTLPRGPPRKPRQSGHALWVGNMPPGANIIELKDHFSRGATNEIESVFLISKSNCAFINYKTDAACNEAMARFHDNRFKGVRLVCRLRRASVPPASPSGATTNYDRPVATEGAVCQEARFEGQVKTGTEAIEGVEVKVEDTRENYKDRIFILKSLTVEDLDLSVKNGVWATQSHNEEVLNRAFEVRTNIFYIFRHVTDVSNVDIRECLPHLLGQ